jgi:hypothetical protein
MTTVTAQAAVPSLASVLAGPALPSADAGGSGPAAAFGMLVEQELAAAPAATSGTPPVTAPAATPATPAPPAADPSLPVPAPASVANAVPVPTGAPAAEPAAQGTAAAHDPADDDAPTTTGADPGAAALVAAPPVPVADALVATPVQTPSRTSGPRAAHDRAGADQVTSTVATDPGGAPAATQPTHPSDTTPSSTAGPVAPVNAPVTAPTAPATDATAVAEPTPSKPVLDQVLPAVPRVVQRGDGTTRLSLKLHPADLGEVHVTVTVKDGVVDVTLAAGHEARQAMGEAGDRLRALLSSGGHTAGQVLLRDLPQVPTTAPQTQPLATTTGSGTAYAGLTDAGTGGASQHRQGGEGHPHPAHHGATATGPDARPDGPTDRRRTRTPAVAGLDVTV